MNRNHQPICPLPSQAVFLSGLGASRIAGSIFLALIVSCGAAQKARPYVTPQERIARTLFFEDSAHPTTPADVIWNRARKHVGPQFIALPWQDRAIALCDVINKDRAFSCWNSGKLWSKPIPDDKASRIVWARCLRIADEMIKGVHVPHTLADHYHTTAVNPMWNRGMQFLGQVGKHLLWRARA